MFLDEIDDFERQLLEEEDYFFADESDYDDEPEAHSCSANADEWGECRICGALISGSIAYCKEYSCDSPEALGDFPRRRR